MRVQHADPQALPYRSRASGKKSPYSPEQLRFIGEFCIAQKPNAKGCREILVKGYQEGMWKDGDRAADADKIRTAVESWQKKAPDP